MSVAAQSPSPFCGKRVHFEEEEENALFGVGKRSRFCSSPASGGRCTPLSERQAYVVSASTYAALRGLFPEMDEQTISTVLQECGDDIDSAIQRLNQLKLCQPGAAAAAQATEVTADAASGAAAGPDATPSQQEQQQQAAAEAAAAAEQQQAAQAQPLDLSPWVDTVVTQMTEAKDVGDARQRAGSVLQAFANAVAETVAGKGGDAAALRAQAAELAKDNHILKRAVAIQNSRLQELSAKEAEAAQLRGMLAQYQEKVHALELSNYSLALHLKQATCAADPSAPHSQRHPDVF